MSTLYKLVNGFDSISGAAFGGGGGGGGGGGNNGGNRQAQQNALAAQQAARRSAENAREANFQRMAAIANAKPPGFVDRAISNTVQNLKDQGNPCAAAGVTAGAAASAYVPGNPLLKAGVGVVAGAAVTGTCKAFP